MSAAPSRASLKRHRMTTGEDERCAENRPRAVRDTEEMCTAMPGRAYKRCSPPLFPETVFGEKKYKGV